MKASTTKRNMNNLWAPYLKVQGTDSTLRHVFYALSPSFLSWHLSAACYLLPRYLHLRGGTRVCCKTLINFRLNTLLLSRSIFLEESTLVSLRRVNNNKIHFMMWSEMQVNVMRGREEHGIWEFWLNNLYHISWINSWLFSCKLCFNIIFIDK